MVAVKIGRATGTLQKNGPFTVVRPRHGKEHLFLVVSGSGHEKLGLVASNGTLEKMNLQRPS